MRPHPRIFAVLCLLWPLTVFAQESPRIAALREHLVIHVANAGEDCSVQLALAAGEIVLQVTVTLGIETNDTDANVTIGAAASGRNLTIQPGLSGNESGATTNE